MLDTISGIPSHPLFVHIPVVLVPALGIAAIVLVFRPAWRRTIGWWLPVAAGVALVGTLLAVGSGEALDERVEGLVDTDRHRSLALTTRTFVAVFFLATVTQTVLDRRREPEAPRSWLAIGAAVAVVATAGLATWWMFLTGEEGARITWSGVVQ